MARRDAIDPVHAHLGNPGEEFQQRDAGIVRVEVGPGRRVARNDGEAVVDEIRPTACIQIWEGEAARLIPSRHRNNVQRSGADDLIAGNRGVIARGHAVQE